MKTAIVLSGGGAKGAYQIGVWKAIKKLNISYNIVSGTSVGALNGLMMVQHDYHKALKIWKNMDYTTVFSNDFKKLNENIYLTYIKQFVTAGGVDVVNLENILSKVYNEKNFYKSKVDFGIIVYNISKNKEEIITKNKVDPKLLVDYIIASAACFPALKVKSIAGSNYIDGGYYDNLPINLAVDLGADKIIAVDLKAPGIKQKPKNKKIDLITICPNNDIGSFLEFDKKLARKAIKYGYNDTMKVFKKFEGKKYTFYKWGYDIITQKVLHNYNKSIVDILTHNKMFKNIKKKMWTIDNSKFQDIIEYAGDIFNVDDSKIYSINRYNYILKKRLNALNDIDAKFIKDKILEKNIKGLLDSKYVVKYIYQNLNKYNDFIELEILSTIFEREFLVALYLMTIKNKGGFYG